MTGIQKHLASIRKEISEIQASEALRLHEDGVTFIDVRDKHERGQGMITGAIGLGRDYLEMQIDQHVPSAHAPIVLYCAGGTRSLLAAKTIQDMGYDKVYSLAGGIGAWKALAYPMVQPEIPDPDFESRYSRHFQLEEVGYEGQKKLSRAKVLVVGAGGLASPVLAYLTAAGVGTIGIVDDDSIEISNLQRQIIHRDHEVGLGKVASAARFSRELNPSVKIVQHNIRLSSINIEETLSPYQIVVDGTDNFKSRFLINDTCIKLNKIHVHGAIHRFSGEVTVFNTQRKENPCYRCLFPEPPPPGLAPSCSEAGVLGVLPGIIGTLQAHETIKLILGLPNNLEGRLLKFDGLNSHFRDLKLLKDPDCSYCT